jgi:hypothetical protein
LITPFFCHALDTVRPQTRECVQWIFRNILSARARWLLPWRSANRINRPNERFVSWLRILACRVILAFWHTAYMDFAMTPVTDDEDLEMFLMPAAPAFLEQEHRRQHAHEHAAAA